MRLYLVLVYFFWANRINTQFLRRPLWHSGQYVYKLFLNFIYSERQRRRFCWPNWRNLTSNFKITRRKWGALWGRGRSSSFRCLLGRWSRGFGFGFSWPILWSLFEQERGPCWKELLFLSFLAAAFLKASFGKRGNLFGFLRLLPFLSALWIGFDRLFFAKI